MKDLTEKDIIEMFEKNLVAHVQSLTRLTGVPLNKQEASNILMKVGKKLMLDSVKNEKETS